MYKVHKNIEEIREVCWLTNQNSIAKMALPANTCRTTVNP